MKLIGMFDSPYVRRVAISMLRLQIPFEHQPLSVFRDFEEFSKLSPVVKAPSLVCDDGCVLVDSTLILQYVGTLASPRSLWPENQSLLRQDLRVTGLALVACEKGVHLIYEMVHRPAEMCFASWIRRLCTQLDSALVEIETTLANMNTVDLETMIERQAGITTAVTWFFLKRKHPEIVANKEFPLIAKFSNAAEIRSEFVDAPFE